MPTLLVLNAGSSSLKFSLYGAARGLPKLLAGQIDGLASTPRMRVRDGAGKVVFERSWDGPLDHDQAFECLFDFLQEPGRSEPLIAVGHRIVHGGMAHAASQRIDAALLTELDALVPLAPLHQPANLAAVRRIAARMPQLPQVACFDTAFHRTQADLQQRYALTEALHQSGIRRYGFHGLSYQYIASVLPAYDPVAAAGKTIVLHLGNGCSLCGLDGARSAACSMGFSTLDGVPMATRCGALDPGVILHLLSARGMDLAAVEQLLYRQSGWLGVSGISADLRVLLASDQAGAQTAIALFVAAIVREVGALAATLGGVDALVFTAGVGENAAPIRARVIESLGWLGMQLDADANARHGPLISSTGSRVRCWVIATDEEAVIAEQTLSILGSHQPLGVPAPDAGSGS